MPMFQHRHYAAIADVLADAREAPGVPGDEAVIDDIQHRLAVMFTRDNDKFNRDRFERAANRAPDMHGKDKVR